MMFAQVPLARFIKVPRRHSYAEWLTRVGHLCADLVICDRSTLVIGVVLLTSSRSSDRAERRRVRMTRVLKAAGIKVFVWREESLPSADLARDQITQRLGDIEEAGARRPEINEPKIAGRPAPGSIPVPEVLNIPFDDEPRREPPPSTWFDDLDSGRVPLESEQRGQSQRGARPSPRATCPTRGAVHRDSAASGQQSLRELARIEGLEIFERFAHADEVDRHRPRRALATPQRQRGKHAALGGAVELGHDQPVSASASSKALTCASAFWPVLPSITSSTSCGALVRPCAIDALDLLAARPSGAAASAGGRRCRRSPRRLPRAAAADRVEAHRGRIAAFLAHDLDVVAARPRPQLLARRGAEGVRRRQQHLAAVARPGGASACRWSSSCPRR
jgi:hypothetical protein